MSVDWTELYGLLLYFGHVWQLLIRVCVQGRMVEIFGKEASGKTTLALHIIKEAQKNGGLHFFYDSFFFSLSLFYPWIYFRSPQKENYYF